MVQPIRRVVTGHDDRGRAVVVSDGPAPSVHINRTSARMAQLAARGELKEGSEFIHQSIIGSIFRGRVEQMTRVGNMPKITRKNRITPTLSPCRSAGRTKVTG